MADFNAFIEEARICGTGRSPNGARSIPAFIPSGDDQDSLFEYSVKHLFDEGFKLIDVRGEQGCEKAVASFPLPWPTFAGVSSVKEYQAAIPEQVKRLLVICGSEYNSRFWRSLSQHSVLYTGAGFPPLEGISPKCIVVPDSACVAAIIKEHDYSNFPPNIFNPVSEYSAMVINWKH